MDEARTFLCTMMHPKLFPAPFTDPGNPLKVTMLVELGDKELIFRASAARAKGKIMGTEALAGIDLVDIGHLDGSTQRMEILRRSMLRMAIVGGIVLIFSLIIRAYPLGISILMVLATAGFTGFLNFLLFGGFSRKQDVVRFYFKHSEQDYIFYLEVPGAQEAELQQVLGDVGLRITSG